MLHYRGSQKGKREREKGPEEIFEKILIIAGNVSNMGKEIVTQDQALREAQAG